MTSRTIVDQLYAVVTAINCGSLHGSQAAEELRAVAELLEAQTSLGQEETQRADEA